MEVSSMIPERIRKKFLQEILQMYAEGELSAGRASHMLGIPRAAFYQLLAETKTPLPQGLNESIKKEITDLLAPMRS